MKNVQIARIEICDSTEVNPKDAIKLSCLLTTRSTAKPIRISGIISNNLFTIE